MAEGLEKKKAEKKTKVHIAFSPETTVIVYRIRGVYFIDIVVFDRRKTA